MNPLPKGPGRTGASSEPRGPAPVPASPSEARPWGGLAGAWQHPALIAAAAALLIVLAALAPSFWRALTQAPGSDPALQQDAPWDADVTADGALRVFGLRLPGSTLGDAQARWGEGLQLALMVPLLRDGPVALEAYVEQARPGGISGRLVLTAQAGERQLQAWRERAVKDEVLSAQTRRLTLHPDDALQALNAPIVAVGFIPVVQLDAQVLLQRFGQPQQRMGAGQPVEHWLYGDRGLAIMLDQKGRELLQYVRPAEFERRLALPLRRAEPAQPLKPASAPAAGPPG
jgi:hypothetical protein